MSSSRDVPVDNEEWIARFVSLAKRIKLGAGGDAIVDPERERSARIELPEDERNASRELVDLLLYQHGELTEAQHERLLRDEDPDIRMAAAMKLRAKNEELRISARRSVICGRSVSEIMEFRRRAREKSPASPSIADMTAEELIGRLIDASQRKALADRYLNWLTNKADSRTSDRLLREMQAIHNQLRTRGLRERLLPLMDNENERVRLTAANKCFDLDPEKTIATLEELEKNGGFRESGEARVSLMTFRREQRDGSQF